MSEEYWEVDAILAECDKLGIEIGSGAVRLGFLDSSSAKQDLSENARIEIPLWLAKELKQVGMEDLTMKVPPFLKKVARTNMEAHARGIDLRATSPNFYRAALLAAQLNPHEGEEIVGTVLKVLSERYLDILDYAQLVNEDVSEIVDRLTVVEADLFNKAYQRSREIGLWKKREDWEQNGTRANKRLRS